MKRWLYFVAVFTQYLLVCSELTGNCFSPWNITIDGNHLRWSGKEREADVLIHLEYDPTNGTEKECFPQTLNVPFSERGTIIESPCSHTLHIVNATIVCNGAKMASVQLQADVPVNISAVKITSTSITLRWSEPEFPRAPIIGYNVRKSTVKDSFPKEVYHTANTEFELAGLQGYTVYYLQVMTLYDSSAGQWSETVIVRTDVAKPFRPTGVSGVSATNSSILVKWREPTPFVGPILNYTIKWARKNSSAPKDTKEVNETSYEITGLSAYTNYSIQVRASTEAGTGPWSSEVDLSTEIGVPSEPRNLSVTNTSSVSISLSWIPPDPTNGPLLQYMISWRPRGSTSSSVFIQDTEYDVVGLSPYTEYVFQVTARTKVDWGLPSKSLSAFTDIDIPSQPRNLTYLEVTNTSIVLEWVTPEKPNGPLLPYIVMIHEYNSTQVRKEESNFTNCTIEGLLPYMEYVIQVRAQTEAGLGEKTDELEFRTKIGIPSAPQNVSMSKVLPTMIHLEWSVPQSPAGPSLDYVVTWGVQGTTASVFNTPETEYEAIGLRPYTKYSFEVAARTEAGSGSAETIIVRTGIAVPSVPGDIFEVSTTENTIHVIWTPPEHPNGPQLLYIVSWTEISENLESSNSTSRTGFLIQSLKSSTNYSIQISAQTSAGRGPSTEVIYVTTNAKGLPKNLPLILGLVLGLVLPLLILFIVGVFIINKKGGLEYLSSRFSSKSTNKKPSVHQYDNPPVQLGVYNLTPKSLTVQNFEERIKHPMYSSRVGLVHEFGDLKENSPQHSCKVAKLEENLPKNRWGKMLPYDHSRVKLLPYADKLRPDFINANYIPGDSYLLEYIASQGPLRETLDDFWTMIWQQSVSVVVMLTQCVEKAVRNCEQYWPQSGQSRVFGEIQVHTQSETILSSYVVRVLAIQHNYQKRHVIHMHFSNWPVSGCPRSPDEFLHFVRKVREQTSERRPGPILVHCSAGVGRTGTFIAVDRLCQHLEHSDDIDIYGTVLDMRRYRPHMVHTEDQYTFIYACIQRFLQERKEPQESLYEVAL